MIQIVNLVAKIVGIQSGGSICFNAPIWSRCAWVINIHFIWSLYCISEDISGIE